MAVGAAIIVAAAIGAGSAYYSSEQQKEALDDDRKRREAEAAAAQAEADRISAETKPEQEALQETKFGADGGTTTVGSTTDFLVPKTSALGGSTTGRSGLGFTV